jgi:cytochrome c biogenesis protein CcmG/thiol:disulfide interchange protein DsbE
MTFYSATERKSAGISRRTLLAGGLAVGGGAAGAWAWRRFDLRSRLFNPFTTSDFVLDPVPGVRLAGGAPAPGFSAADLKGSVTVLNFWASWCPPCIEEHPHLVALARDSRVRIFGANYKDTPEAATRFLSERGNPYAAVGADRSGFLSRAFGARGVPWTLVLDRDARVQLTFTGAIDAAAVSTRLVPVLEKLL